MSFLPALLTGVSALSGYEQNRKAKRTADEGLDMERQTVARKNKMFDTLLSIVQDADRAGEFDPTRRIADVNADSLKEQEGAQRAAASASTILGYRPGDSAPLQSLKGISESYDLSRRKMDSDIRDQAFNRKLGAYSSLNAPTEGITVGRDIGQVGQSGMQDLSGLFASIMPFLQEKKAVMTTRPPLSSFNTVNTMFRGVRGR